MNVSASSETSMPVPIHTSFFQSPRAVGLSRLRATLADVPDERHPAHSQSRPFTSRLHKPPAGVMGDRSGEGYTGPQTRNPAAVSPGPSWPFYRPLCDVCPRLSCRPASVLGGLGPRSSFQSTSSMYRSMSRLVQIRFQVSPKGRRVGITGPCRRPAVCRYVCVTSYTC